MNPVRLRPRVPSRGRISVRLDPAQRDLFTRAPGVPRALAHLLRRAPVREGKLTVRVGLGELQTLSAAAAAAPAAGRREERELATLLRYLEDLEDRFLEAPEETDEDARGAKAGHAPEDFRRAGMSEE